MNYNPDNIFYKIIQGELPSAKIYEDENFLAIHDKFPKYETHLLFLPKKKLVSMIDFLQEDTEYISLFFKTMDKIIKDQNLDKLGCKFVTNHMASMDQVIFHFHMHILSGKKLINACKISL